MAAVPLTIAQSQAQITTEDKTIQNLKPSTKDCYKPQEPRHATTTNLGRSGRTL